MGEVTRESGIASRADENSALVTCAGIGWGLVPTLTQSSRVKLGTAFPGIRDAILFYVEAAAVSRRKPPQRGMPVASTAPR